MGGEDAIKTGRVHSADPPTALRIVPLAPQHAADAARLHIAGQPGTFLSSLGPDVLEVVYATLPRTGTGFGFAAVTTGVDAVDTVAGFVSATTGVGRLFVETGTTQARKLLPALAARFTRNPVLVGRTFQTALYPILTKNEAGEAEGHGAELLSIMVEHTWRDRGIGSLLLEALSTECKVRGVRHLDVTVDAANEGARRFYTRHDFTFQGQFHLYGRDMHLYGRQV